jgi:hypothetical protein
MSQNKDIHRHNPNSYHLTRRGRIAASVAGASLAVLLSAGIADAVSDAKADNAIDRQVSSPDALARLQAGQIDPTKVVVVTAPESGTAWNMAGSLNPTGDIREVSDVIDAQAGPDGVQEGEKFVIDKNDIAPTEQTAGQ